MKPVCEAITITKGWLDKATGEQCVETATHTKQGRPVCWVHYHAIREIKYVDKKKILDTRSA